MARKCSHCGYHGHNSRTCSAVMKSASVTGFRLFGVQIHSAPPSLKKSLSMNCLSLCTSPLSSSSSPSSSASSIQKAGKAVDSCMSHGFMYKEQERRKGVPWSEEEHKVFLAGLAKLGKGDWRGIARSFVTTRTPTQVASHAQKYFLRKNSLARKHSSSSLLLDFKQAQTYPQASSMSRKPEKTMGEKRWSATLSK